MQLRNLAPVLAVAIAAGALGAPAGAGNTAETVATFVNNGNDGDARFRFYGDVEVMGSQKCVPDRKVDFYVKEDGPDTFIGRTRSDTFGRWSITIPLDVFSEGIAYVKVLKKTLKNGTVCLPDKSNEFQQI